MAKNKKEEVVEKTTEVTKEVTQKEQPKVDSEVGKLKVKKPKMKKFNQSSEDEVIKVDLNKSQKTEEDAVQNRETEKVDVGEQTGDSETVGEGGTEPDSKETQPVKDEPKVEDTPVVEEITDEETKEEVEEVKEEIIKAVEEAETTGKPLPENIEKLMKFMEDTGGDLEDYVKLNRDTSKLEDQDVLYEYYKKTKPHLNNEEINFLMNDQFEYDEEVDEEKDIKRKKLALKEQVASARAHLDGQKSKYYEQIKAGSKLTPAQQKAMDFFNRYNKESEEAEKTYQKQNSTFLNKTDKVFNKNFKGFEYNVGEKKYRFNVKDVDSVKQNQSDLNNFVKKFLNKDNVMEDAKGYHKSIFTATNADAIARHFYEQGKADAIKQSVADAKNVNMEPRQAHGDIEGGGIKVRVLGEDSSDFKFKIKNKR